MVFQWAEMHLEMQQGPLEVDALVCPLASVALAVPLAKMVCTFSLWGLKNKNL